MYCTHCGRVIADDSRFCTFCGSHVTPAKSSSVGGQPGKNGGAGGRGSYTKTWTGSNVRTQEQIKQTAQQYQPKKDPKPQTQTQVVPAQPKSTALQTKVQRGEELQTRVLGIPMSGKAATGVYLFALIASLLAAIFGA